MYSGCQDPVLVTDLRHIGGEKRGRPYRINQKLRFQSQHSLKTESCHNANFVVIGGMEVVAVTTLVATSEGTLGIIKTLSYLLP